MPFLIPVAAAAVGFGGGLLTAGAIDKAFKLALVGGAVYLIYINTSK